MGDAEECFVAPGLPSSARMWPFNRLPRCREVGSSGATVDVTTDLAAALENALLGQQDQVTSTTSIPGLRQSPDSMGYACVVAARPPHAHQLHYGRSQAWQTRQD